MSLRWKRGTFEFACAVEDNLEDAVTEGKQVRLVSRTVYARTMTGWLSDCGTWGMEKSSGRWRLTHVPTGYSCPDFHAVSMRSCRSNAALLDATGPRYWHGEFEFGKPVKLSRYVRRRVRAAQEKAVG